jgi:hypothetical protein
MKFTSVEIKNFRSFRDTGTIKLGAMNVLIGANNAGKSSLLKALHAVQVGHADINPDLRLGTRPLETSVEIGVEDVARYFSQYALGIEQSKKLTLLSRKISVDQTQLALGFKGSDRIEMEKLSNVDPSHFIVPFLSQRKTTSYQEDTTKKSALTVTSNFSNLAAKLGRVCSPSFPNSKAYTDSCMEILGFVVSQTPSQNGMRPGTYVNSNEVIPIEQMGEGVPHIVGLLVDLALSEGKLFLIEEPENDLHPKALKALLELIQKSAEKNQFVISTHSNIVVRHLASLPDSRLYNITLDVAINPPEATIVEVANTPEARIKVLRELGYELFDFDLWDGWLILEESSAERIIRDYLIPWFAPKLSRIRTIAASSISQVEANFEDLNRLVRFTHLEDAYKDAVWVRVDGDDIGKETCITLQKRYTNWKSDRFDFFDQAQFEKYYPEEFRDASATALAIQNQQAKRAAKNELLAKVRNWLDEDEERARKALETSAKCVIAHLQKIECQLLKRGS